MKRILVILVAVIAIIWISPSRELEEQVDEKTTDFPTKPLTLIVPYAVGDKVDLMARAFAKQVEKHLDQPLVVMNRAGGEGASGMNLGAGAKADGYTITMTTTELTILTHLGLTSVSIDDFIPILQINHQPIVLIVQYDSPFETIEDLMNFAKEKPGKLKLGNGGSERILEFATSVIETEAEVEWTHVFFDKNETAMNSLIGGQVDALTMSAPDALEQVKLGLVRTLAVLSNTRINSMLDVPTFQEMGYDVTSLASWKAFSVPSHTPDEIVAILSEAFLKAANEDEYIQYMKENGLEMVMREGQELQYMINEQNKFFENMTVSLR